MPASPRGYHTLTEYRDCPRKFFLHRICGFEPQVDKSSLIVGRLVHLFQERVFNAQKVHAEVNIEEFLSMIHADLVVNRASFYAQEDFDRAERELMLGCSNWFKTFYAQDSANLIPIQAEWLLKTKLANGFDLTGRLDRVYWSLEDEEFVIMDTKTTRWGAYTVEKAFALDDQATVYEALLRNAGPIQIEGVGERNPAQCTIAVIPDIMDFKPKNPVCLRTVCIRKNSIDWEQFDMGACRTIEDIQKSIQAYTEKLDVFYAFPCYASTCSKFGCEWSDLCKVYELEPASEATPGFIKIAGVSELFFQEDLDISSDSTYTDEGGIDNV